MSSTLTIIIVCIACSCPALDRFAVLSRVESATKAHPDGDDQAVGAAGERGRYQETEAVWREFNPTNCWQNFHYLTNSNFALASVQGVMANRSLQFKSRTGRWPSDFEWYLLWSSPSRVDHPTKFKASVARRFANLCSRP